MSDTAGFGYGQQEPNDSSDEFNKISFLVKQLVNRLSTMKLVKVMKVSVTAGALGPAGTVDVLPLVMQIDGGGHTTPHATVFGIPYFRMYGGRNAVICDPEVGDIGYVVCSDRDISAVKGSRDQAPPGSLRQFDVADGVYVGGVLAEEPEQYITFTATGIKIADKNGNVLEMKSGGTFLTGNLSVSGAISQGTGPTLITLGGHTHPGNNLPPTPGH